MRPLLRRLGKIPAIRRLYYTSIMKLPDEAGQVVRDRTAADPVHVADLMARYTAAEHVARADAYFVREQEEASLFRRPFQDAEDAQSRLTSLSLVLQHLALTPGARVLDFGCGTGWLSRCLATMGADMLAVDVSQRVLDLARRWLQRDPLADELRVEFRRFDSVRLPAEDVSVDRIVSFDAFHHVLDQEATLAEMARVLRPGGIAVFHEPGPRHSATPDAQHEMREHGVIENDIDVHRIWRAAQGCGFADIRLSLPTLRAPIVALDQFDRIAAGRPGMGDMLLVTQNTYNFTDNLRIFALHKAGSRKTGSPA